MAVRDALLTLLTMGPAYGFQLHGGVEARTGGRRQVNVGQTYATLDRLTAQKLITPAGTTDDGLPLHALTPAGETAALAWLGGVDAAGADPWDETVDRVLIALSLPGVDAESTVDGELARWRGRLAAAEANAAVAGVSPDPDTPLAPEAELAVQAAHADAAKARAALEWLGGVSAVAASSSAFAPKATRPRRGRRPAAPRRADDEPTSSADGGRDGSAQPSARA
ncbi:PadR family transcriptional regulator [Agromyces ramosus]|uniref:DNA-binding PadR family transcriptional regulator n=1 Tax=Agromyces ramosus TaxID=33879 RepID=A0ABU0RD38_9MICO|nr:helix-turn-helix transcriptional regulator [Agromyces ramosus]MDQ0895975.1 DNA-binding PadR family transcriptional regulator [Agromyces ramosus]